ncbi:aldo/keto reductase [Caenispirillum bisanense]|uniref:Predicted oxidoreductase n=1 Tax=Caenispirillum bisanense TaxID=414052 RepID=A0A286G3K3_9PROT|nr:aldo/keto reductase [Caenispirillum bisanense]SOD90147.1 Predicted oxidoreductase [Caenispirillum bisanense]
MQELDAAAAGTILIGADLDDALEVSRLGFGAMRLTGPGIWDYPDDVESALGLLRRLPDLGVTFIDTADSYGPDVSEELIAEALHPYDDLVIATKGGLVRTGPDEWIPLGRPEYLIQQALKSCRTLGVDTLDLWQLHRIDPRVPRDEQFDAIRRLYDDEVMTHVGLSEVSVEDIEAAQEYFPVATVQNRFNLVDRTSEEVLRYCEREGIVFIPWYPLAAGDLAKPGSLLDDIARRHEATPGQIALAWLLAASPMTLPIPGTSSLKHLEENVAAAAIMLDEEEIAALDKAGREQFERARR